MAHPELISDHVGTNPIIISERHTQHSYLAMWEHLPQPCQKGPALTFINQCQKGSALTLGHARNQSSMPKGSTLTSENQCQKGSALISDNQCKKGSTLIFDHARNQSSMSKCSTLTSDNQCQKGSTLTSDHVGTNPTVTSEWPSV